MPPEDESLPAARGSRRLLLAGLAVGLVALAGWAMATPLAFQRVWLPLAGRALEGRVEAEGGHWVWPAGLVADGVDLDLAAVKGTVGRMEFDLAPWASLLAGHPVVSHLLLEGAQLHVEGGADDASSPPETAAADRGDDAARIPSFEIRHARVSDVRVTLAEEGRSTELGPIRLDVDDWFGVARGRASFEVPATRRLAAGVEQTLRARGSVTLGDVAAPAVAPASEDEEPAVALAEAGESETDAEEKDTEETDANEAKGDEADAEESSTGEATPTPARGGDRARLVVELDLDVDDGAASGLEPLALALRARGWVSEAGEAIDLDEASLTLTEGAVRRGRLAAKGALLPDLDVQLEVDAEHLESDLVSPDDDLRLRGDVALAGSWDAPRIQPDLHLGPLPSATAEAEELLLHLTGSIELLDGFRRMRLEPLRVESRGPAGNSGGRLDLRGLADLRGTAELRVGTEAWQLLPWMRLAGMTPGEQVDALTLSGTLTAKLAEGATTAEGDLKLVLESREDGETAPEAAVALVSPSLRLEGDALEASVRITDPGEARTHLDVEASIERPADATRPVRVTADLRRLDATPWAALWTNPTPADAASGDVEDAEESVPTDAPAAGGADAAAADADRSAGYGEAAPRLWEIGVGLGSLRYRETTAEGGRLDVRLGPSWEADLEAVTVGDGRVSGTVAGSERGGGLEVSWSVDVEDLDLEVLNRSLRPTTPLERAGLLDLRTSGRGEGRGLEAALGAANGRFEFEVLDGRVGGGSVLHKIAKAADIAGFELISFDGLRGDYLIENGTMFVDDLRLDGKAVHLVGVGELRLEGLDMTVNPRVGPELRAMVPGTLVDGLVGTAGGVLALPLVVRASGSWADFTTRVEPATPALLGDLFRGVTGLLRNRPTPARDIMEEAPLE